MGLSIQSVFRSGPFSTMMPAISWPRVKGQGSGFGQWPFRMCRSVPQTPQAPILIRADFGDIFGQATRRMTGSAPGPSKVATRIRSMSASPFFGRGRSSPRHDHLRLRHDRSELAVLPDDLRLPHHRGAAAVQRQCIPRPRVAPTGIAAKKLVLLSIVVVIDVRSG